MVLEQDLDASVLLKHGAAPPPLPRHCVSARTEKPPAPEEERVKERGTPSLYCCVTALH